MQQGNRFTSMLLMAAMLSPAAALMASGRGLARRSVSQPQVLPVAVLTYPRRIDPSKTDARASDTVLEATEPAASGAVLEVTESAASDAVFEPEPEPEETESEAPAAEAILEALGKTRFAVGDRVECNLGSKGGWAVGTVIAVNYESQELGVVPYRVQLKKEDRVILAAVDRDTSIRQASNRNAEEDELEAMFFSFDMDGGGTIDADELSDVLDSFGYTLAKERVQELFYQFGKNDQLDFQQFRTMMKTLTEGDAYGVKKQPAVKKAMDLFRKFDKDRSGTIDKFEFKAIVAEQLGEKEKETRIALALGAVVGAAAEYLAMQYVHM